MNLIKKSTQCLSVFVASLLYTSVNAQEVITLQKAIDLSLNNNIKIKNAELNIVLDKKNLVQAQNNKLPNLFSNNQTYTYYGRSIDPATNLYSNSNIVGTNETILSQLVLYQGGLLKNQVIESKLFIEADKFKSEKVKYDIILNVIEAYLQVLAYQDIVKATQQQTDVINQTLNKLQKNIEIGNNKRADLTQLKAQLANSELNKIKAENQLGLSMLTLKQLMEIDVTKNIGVAVPDITNHTENTQYATDDIFSTAVNINPDVSLAETNKKAAYQSIALAKSLYYPTVILFGGINTNYSSGIKQLVDRNVSFQPIGYLAGSPSQIVLAAIEQPIYGTYSFGSQLKDHLNEALGITLQIPIFNRFTARTSVQKAEVNYQIATNNALLAKENLRKTIAQAIFDLRSAGKKYEVTQLTYNANKDASVITQERYNLGLAGIIEYNTSLSNLDRAQYEMIQARYELLFKNKLIDYYLGKDISFSY